MNTEVQQQFFAAVGLATSRTNGDILEAWYPNPVSVSPERAHELGMGDEVVKQKQIPADLLPDSLVRAGGNTLIRCVLNSAEPPSSVADAYLRLHLLSHRLVQPNQINLDGLFGILPNIAWSSRGPLALEDVNHAIAEARADGTWLKIYSVDKFPPMTDYVIPAGTRIADTARVRLGAYLGEGTTVMHEGFINFNAGTLGRAMVEGRISSGVVVGQDSDLGGGASTMGTLSGGNTTLISLGRNCLIGANAGLGIPLGDNCTIEAGLYLTGGAKVEVLDDTGKVIERKRAAELAGSSDLLFIRNSLTGAIQARPNKKDVRLNDALHQDQ